MKYVNRVGMNLIYDKMTLDTPLGYETENVNPTALFCWCMFVCICFHWWYFV